MNVERSSLVVLLFFTLGCGSEAPGGGYQPPPPPDPGIEMPMVWPRFLRPRPLEQVASPVVLEMDATGVTIAPATTIGDGFGYFVVTIDAPCPESGALVPADSQHWHFDDGRRMTDLPLTEATHQLCLSVVDRRRRAYDGRATLVIAVW